MRRAMKKVDHSIKVCSEWAKPAFVRFMGQRRYDCLAAHPYRIFNKSTSGTRSMRTTSMMPAERRASSLVPSSGGRCAAVNRGERAGARHRVRHDHHPEADRMHRTGTSACPMRCSRRPRWWVSLRRGVPRRDRWCAHVVQPALDAWPQAELDPIGVGGDLRAAGPGPQRQHRARHPGRPRAPQRQVVRQVPGADDARDQARATAARRRDQPAPDQGGAGRAPAQRHGKFAGKKIKVRIGRVEEPVDLQLTAQAARRPRAEGMASESAASTPQLRYRPHSTTVLSFRIR